MITLSVLAVLTALLIGFFVVEYNSLVELKANVSKAKANIDVLLKQRNEEIPKLVEICKQYMQYELPALEKVIQARKQVILAQESDQMDSIGRAETVLRTSLNGLMALAEDYPDLKANENFAALSTRVSRLQDTISDRREFYNDQVTLNNTRIGQIPAIWIATRFGFQEAKLLEFAAQELADPNLKSLFESK
jgi:LemA protein